MKAAACALVLNDVPVSAYGLRHGDASYDLLAKRRAPLGVRQRGGWASDRDFKWNAMQIRSLTELLRVGLLATSFGQVADAALPRILLQSAPRPELGLTCPMLELFAGTGRLSAALRCFVGGFAVESPAWATGVFMVYHPLEGLRLGAAVDLGKKQLRFAFGLIALARSRGAPVYLENPGCPRVWSAPALKALLGAHDAASFDLDTRAFGEGGSAILGERRVVEAGVCCGVLGVVAGVAATGLVARQGVSQSVPGLLATLTADGDHYAEETRSDDAAEVRWSGVQGATPAGVDARQVYRFRAMPSDAGLEQLKRDGALLAARLHQLQRPPPQPGRVERREWSAAAPAAWLATEDFRGLRRGERLPDPLPPNAEVHGDVALAPVQGGWVAARLMPAAEIDAFVIDDHRALPAKFSQEGARRRPFTETVDLQVADEPEGGLMLDGLPSCLRVLRSWRDAGLAPVTHHSNWLRARRIPDGDRSIHGHEVLCRALESMISVDQLNAPALQSAELVCRRLQVIEDAHAASPSAPDYSAADEHMKHVAANLRDKAAVLKETRKAKEEQKLRREPKGAATGDPAKDGVSMTAPPPAEELSSPLAAAADRQRDLFPLPLIQPTQPTSGSVSSSTRRRLAHRRRSEQLANEAIAGLNALHPPCEQRGQTTAAHRLAAATVLHHVRSAPMTTTTFSRRGAAKELLATSPSYTGNEAPSPVVQHVRSRVDIPEVDAAAPAVETVLGPIGMDYVLDSESKMMLTPDEWPRNLDSEPPVTPYMDVVLKSDAGAYHLFISDLDLATPFFVAKKSGAQRLVWDARAPNRRFRAPPPLSMGASAAYGRLHLPGDRDDANYFYALGLPTEIGLYFSLPPVSRAALSQWGVEAVDAPDSPSGGWVWRFLRVVPMGWSWAIWLGQRANAHICCLASGLWISRVLTDHGPVPPLDGGEPFLLPYCDNINVIGTDPDRGNLQLNAICAEWRRHGVLTHEAVEATDTFTSLGRFVDGGPHSGQLDVFSDVSTAEAPKIPDEDLQRDPRELNPDFIEVPAEALQDYDWKEVVSARFHVKEPITIVEGRAASMTSRHVFRSQAAFGHLHLKFGDHIGRPAASSRLARKDFLKGRPLVGATRAERSAKRQGSSGPFRILDESDRGFLEWNAVAPQTQAYYEEALTEFRRFASSRGLALATAADADLALTNYADYAWSIGLERADLLKTHAAFISECPDFSRKGSFRLPRFSRALQGWKRLDPGQTRPPIPWQVAALLAKTAACDRGFPKVGLMIVVMFWAYLRPSEALGLREQDVFLPSGSCKHYGCNPHPSVRGESSKMGLADESSLLDSVEVPWLGPLVARCLTRNPTAMLFRTDAQELGRLWGPALAFARIGRHYAPYQLRHGGPSHDRLCRRRSLAETKDRGRWASDNMMKRHEAHALVQQELTEPEGSARRVADAAPSQLERALTLALSWQPAPRAPPRKLQAARRASEGAERSRGRRLASSRAKPFLELMRGSARLASTVAAAGWASQAADLSDLGVIARLERSILDTE
ncbi:unnamed protein product, partial [Prorocentrum cordatum]